MNKQKSLLTCTVALGLLLGLGDNAQAEEWEQTFRVDLSRHEVGDPVWGFTRWGFSKDSIVEGYSNKHSTWEFYESCVCGFMFGSCGYDLISYNFFDYDQHFWNVTSKDGLKEGTALDLADTAIFKQADTTIGNRDGSSLVESYVFKLKDNDRIDTNYFVYQKDTTYYALCQYITVYDWSPSTNEGVPRYIAHQCIFQNDGTPTFSKIPMYSGELPEGKLIQPPSVVSKPIGKTVQPNGIKKPYLVNGQSAKGNSSSGIRVEKERVYRQ